MIFSSSSSSSFLSSSSSPHLVLNARLGSARREKWRRKKKKDFVIVRRGTTHTTPVISAYTTKQWDSLSLFLSLFCFFLSFFLSLFSTSSYPPYPVDLSNSTQVRSIEIIDCQSNSFSCIRRQWWHSNNKRLTVSFEMQTIRHSFPSLDNERNALVVTY